MIRYLLRWIILLSGLFVLPLLVIRAQPYDDSELRALLTPPEGCPAPCFIGIRPGVTTVEEAIAILEEHEWVHSLDYPISEPSIFISFEWGELAPPIIVPHSKSKLFIVDRIIYNMNIQTTYSVGAVDLLKGKPLATFSGALPSGVEVSAYYVDRSMMIYAFLDCPVTQTKFWNSDLYVRFGDFRVVTGLKDINFACE